MDSPHFDALTRRFTIVCSRRGLGLLAALSLRGLVASNPAAAKKKKRCPPCKRRKKGKCKGTLPNGTPCPGGACQGGSCRAVPCPGQKQCEGTCIPTDQCCTVENCSVDEGDLCCNGECTFDKLETGEACIFQDTCCSNYCQQVSNSGSRRCAATCRGKGCGQDSDCCRGLRCEQVGSFHGCGGCLDTGLVCDSDADCCFSACTALPGTTDKGCLSFPGGPCQKNYDCWSCLFEGACTVPISGGSRVVCHEGVCGCPYQCCSQSDCELHEFCDFDANGLNGECKPIIGP